MLSAVQDGKRREDETIHRLSRAPQGGWTARDPPSTLLLASDGGERTLALAPRVVPHVAQVRAPAGAPLFGTDGWRAAMLAWLPHEGAWGQAARRRASGPAPQPRWMPLPERLDAQGGQTIRRWRLVAGKPRGGCGTLEATTHVLSPLGWQRNTACMERLNRSRRQHGAALGRRTSLLGQGEDGGRQQLALEHVYDNVARPQASCRQRWAEPVRTHRTGCVKLWRPWTPTMAAGWPEHGWTLPEVRR